YERLGEFFITIGGSFRNPFDAASTIGREADNLQKILDIIADDDAIEGVAIEMRSRDFETKPETVDVQIQVIQDYQQRTGQPVVAIMPEGGVGAVKPETIVSARYYTARAGLPVFPSFQRAAQALGRTVRYWGWRDEVGA